MAHPQLLNGATASNFLFAHMTPAEREDVFSLFERWPVKAGDVVVRQSEPGDFYYVVEGGQYDVFVQAGLDPPLLVHTYSSSMGQAVGVCMHGRGVRGDRSIREWGNGVCVCVCVRHEGVAHARALDTTQLEEGCVTLVPYCMFNPYPYRRTTRRRRSASWRCFTTSPAPPP